MASSPPLRGWVPPALTAGSLALLGVAVVIGRVGAARADAPHFVDSVPWLSWLVLSGVALNVFALLLVASVLLLRDAEPWGLDDRSVLPYLGCSVALAAVLVGVRLWWGGANPDLPVTGLALRTGAILGTGLIACIPWLAIVWLAHATVLGLDVDEGDRELLTGRLVRLWRLVVTVVSAFSAVVVVAILCSGALRSAFLLAHPDRPGDFPPQNVLLYGGLFAMLLALVTVPLVVSWRTRAQRLVDAVEPTASAKRTALEARLRLDLPLLKNPITALSVFAPLVTSLLAAFVPQLGR